MSEHSATANPESFYQEARFQGRCAVCGRGALWHAHHVIPRQPLRKKGLPEFDLRNALRLCEKCHMSFTWAGPGKIAVLVKHLTQQNLCYIFELMGEAGVDFLNRYYGGVGDDPRWWCHEYGDCLECQLPSH